jgi:dephospho-CoA kinase
LVRSACHDKLAHRADVHGVPGLQRKRITLHVIGLTGGMGVGKSEVSALLERLGASIIDADREGHAAYAKGTIGWRRITVLFGEGMLNEELEIDRRKLGQLVFGNAQAMGLLNSALHPIIRGRIEAQLRQLMDLGCAVAVVDAAVLIQAGWDDLTDEVWFVKAPTEIVAERVAQARGLQAWEIMGRINAQQELVQEAEAKAGVVIGNAGSMEELREKIEQLWKVRNLPVR